MNGDRKWMEHELRTLAVQKHMFDKVIDRTITKISAIKEGGGTIDEETMKTLKSAAADATFVKRKMVEIRKKLNKN